MPEQNDRDALEAACLEGLVLTEHGYRYRPALGADAVERWLADRDRADRLDPDAARGERGAGT